MRLAVFVDQVFWEDAGQLSTDEPYALFLASFADVCDRLILIGRRSLEPGPAPYRLDQPNIGLFGLPYYDSLYNLWRSDPRIYGRITAAVRAVMHGWDALLLCGPHPIGQLLLRQCIRAGVPVGLIVRQNLVEQMGAHSGLKRVAAMLAARVLDWDFKRLAHNRTVFTVGDALSREYRAVTGRVHPHAPCLVDDAQFVRLGRMEAGDDPLRLLCVGRLAPEKGHDYLLQALAALKGGGIVARLDVVGTGPLETTLKQRAASLGVAGQVTFHGYVPYGPELFAHYQRAGILILPSLTEGLPQVIGESLSVGLPTVATSVGGIPAFLADGQTALLVPPRDPEALAGAIERLHRDQPLRHALARNGRALMRENTLEANRNRIMRAIRDELLAAPA
jgi:glycosyltransferase involved in cell wall biosynthesis